MNTYDGHKLCKYHNLNVCNFYQIDSTYGFPCKLHMYLTAVSFTVISCGLAVLALSDRSVKASAYNMFICFKEYNTFHSLVCRTKKLKIKF